MPKTDRPGVQGAQAALDTYIAHPGLEEYETAEPETAFIDLIADLLHLADSLGVSGEYIADKARDYYDDEQ